MAWIWCSCGCGVGRKLQLQVHPIAWELPYATSLALKKKNVHHQIKNAKDDMTMNLGAPFHSIHSLELKLCCAFSKE